MSAAEKIVTSDSTHLASQEDMKKHKIPLHWRDHCSGLLIPLKLCRDETYSMPWQCHDERHAYEKCQYDEYQRRVAKMTRMKAEAAGK